MKLKRMTAALLLLVMLLSCLPLSVLAADAESVEAENTVDAAPAKDAEVEALPAAQSADGENFFYFSAETKKTLLVAPRKIPFTVGQRICDALEAAGITLRMTSDGFLSAINGVARGYTVLSAPSPLGLRNEPEQGGFICVTENKDTDDIGDGWQLLIEQMVQYSQEAQDVRLAAESAYNAACQNYCGVTDDTAKIYAEAIQTAISEYKAAQETKYTVSFHGAFYDCTITAESAYKKQFAAEADGTLRLPNGSYTFFIRKGNRSVSGALTVKNQDQTLTDLPALPSEEWIDTGTFALSRISDYDDKFDTALFPLTAPADGYTQSAAVPDTFSGNIYPCFCLSEAGKTAEASIRASYINTAGESVSEPITSGQKNKQLTKTLMRGCGLSGKYIIPVRAAMAVLCAGYTFLLLYIAG